MTRIIALLILSALACTANVPITPTVTAVPTATITAHPAQPERMVQRSTVTPIRSCAVTAEVLTVRACGDVQCAAIGWLTQGEVVTTTQTISGWVWIGNGFINSVFCEEVK